MQNNVTTLSQKLQRSLDNNYNVIDMPAVIEIISTLERTAVTKELLETTRLGKYINELRRRTSNESLAKRAKELVKKWRDLVLPEANGQLKSNHNRSGSPDMRLSRKRAATSVLGRAPGTTTDFNNAKRPFINGQIRELDLSDNSNCSIKDSSVVVVPVVNKKTDVILINSDSNSNSNSSLPEPVEIKPIVTNVPVAPVQSPPVPEPPAEQPVQPKKRGRKKGSKNHKNLVIAAEESFTNKMAVSRNSKVKTTQELLADLQNRSSSKQNQSIEMRTAQLTESLSRIDKKLNPQKLLNRNVVRNSVPESEVLVVQSDDEIVDVVGTPDEDEDEEEEEEPVQGVGKDKKVPVSDSDPNSNSNPDPETVISDLLKQLPSLDVTCLDEPEQFPNCICPLPVCKIDSKDQIEVASSPQSKLEFEPKPEPEPESKSEPEPIEEENNTCPTCLYLRQTYRLDLDLDTKLDTLHNSYLPNVNGNYGFCDVSATSTTTTSLNIVPNMTDERLAGKDLRRHHHSTVASENFQKYSISIDSGEREEGENVESSDKKNDRTEFREWHETLDVPSYNDETLRVLPYVVID